MVNHKRRFQIGITLIVLGLPLALIADLRWVKHGGLPAGLLALLGVVMLVYGAMQLTHKRSV